MHNTVHPYHNNIITYYIFFNAYYDQFPIYVRIKYTLDTFNIQENGKILPRFLVTTWLIGYQWQFVKMFCQVKASEPDKAFNQNKSLQLSVFLEKRFSKLTHLTPMLHFYTLHF